MLKVNHANTLSVCIFPLEGKRTHIYWMPGFKWAIPAGGFFGGAWRGGGGCGIYNLCEVKRMRKKSWPAFSVSCFMLIPENRQLQATVGSQNQFPEGKTMLSQPPGIYVLVIPDREGIWEPKSKRIPGVTAPSAAQDGAAVPRLRNNRGASMERAGCLSRAAFQKINCGFTYLLRVTLFLYWFF